MKRDENTELLDDLRELSALDARDEHLRAELRAMLLERAGEGIAVAGATSRLRRRARAWVRGAAAVAASALAAVVVASVLLGGAGGASAQSVLSRAASVRFAVNQGEHLVYDVTMMLSGRTATGTGDIWIQTDARGEPVRVAEALRLAKGPAARAKVIERDVQTPAGVYSYDGTHNTILVPSRADPTLSTRDVPSVPLPAYLFDGTTVAQRVARNAQGGVRLLTRRTIDGATVDAVQVDGWPNGAATQTTLYFDADSHLLRGFDSVGTDPSYNSPSWRVRLTRRTSVPSRSIPPDTFSLNAPAGASVAPPIAMSPLLQVCRGQVKQLLSTGQSLLDACRTSNPGLTRDALVDALSGSAKGDLYAAVKAGQITARQAAEGLAAQRVRLIELVIASHPTAKATGAGGK